MMTVMILMAWQLISLGRRIQKDEDGDRDNSNDDDDAVDDDDNDDDCDDNDGSGLANPACQKGADERNLMTGGGADTADTLSHHHHS